MSPLPATPNEDDWVDEIFDEARGEFWCEIEVFTPGPKGTYNTTTGVRTGGGPDTIHIARRAARAQNSGRLAQETAGAYEWGTKQRFNFQVELKATDPLIDDSMSVRVLSTRRTQALTRLTFQVTKAIGSDHAPILTIQTITEARVAPSG